MRLPQYILISILFLTACSSNRLALNTKETDNKTITSGQPLGTSENNKDSIIFKGNNNTVIIEYFDAFFNDKNSKDIIIIEGNGNVFRLTHRSGFDNSINSSDTIILKGNDNYIEILHKYFLNNTSNSAKKQSIIDNYQVIIVESGQKVYVDSLEKIENKLSNEWVSIKKASSYYLKESVKGNTKAIYYLGELYHLGIGVSPTARIAAYYYEIAAKKGHIDSQSMLAYLLESDWEDLNKNIEKAKYWYTKAADQGDSFAQERLKMLE